MSASFRRRPDIDERVEQYVSISLQQDDALGLREIGRYNRLAKRLWAIQDALRDMDGDERKALLKLLDHANFQVRLNAALATLAIAPQRARRVLEAIASSKHGPQNGNAGMALLHLDRGIFRPT
ncbi:MAG TPA: DUF2019 domain-containing protein [Bauldia sp.]|nr:DUF2019 domain-containing protein [Bauldia sp.]